MMSEQIKELATALSKAQGQFDHAQKSVKNEFFKSKYADLASVIDAAKKPLSDNGLSVAQNLDTDANGNVILITMLLHSSGEFITGSYPVRPVKTDPQSMGSAITYARRYAFSAITGIAADDDDGNAASSQKAPQPPQPKPHQPVVPAIPAVTTCPNDKFEENYEKWESIVKSGKKTPAEFIAAMKTKTVFTAAQIEEIEGWKNDNN